LASSSTSLVDWHPAVDSLSNDDRVGGDQRREPVERALGADLLKGPDRDVRDEDPEEQGISPRRERDRQHAEEQQDAVGDVQRVGADDARVGAARALARQLAARLETLRCVLLAEAPSQLLLARFGLELTDHEFSRRSV
jgi:hypothetical protein